MPTFSPAIIIGTHLTKEPMAALTDAIDIKRKSFFEFENTPYLCLEAVVNTPTANAFAPHSRVARPTSTAS